MQHITHLNARNLGDYSKYISSDQQDNISSLAHTLHRKKIVEVNATAFGGGVVELLQGKIALMQGMGIDANWYVLPPNDDFFHTTKELHNCLQGKCELPSQNQLIDYSDYLKKIATDLPNDADIYVLHDPQTLGLAPYLPADKLIWRCHIDLTDAESHTLNWLHNYYQYFEKLIFSMPCYAKNAPKDKVTIVRPSIDPLSDKNKPLTQGEIDVVLNKYKLNTKPYLIQISRFDKFKDPLGVLDIYQEICKLSSDYDLVLVGNMATDDPEGQSYFEKVQAVAQTLPEPVQFITEASDSEINAFQRGASAVFQNSNREGFGLTVTEALWKEQIVFSRPVGGIALQVFDNITGFFLDQDNNISAEKIVEVLENSNKYSHIQKAAHELVLKEFLLPTMTQGYLATYLELIN
ncbi:glycosyltransferase [Candidatus Saccharibacteria bacterium]|nr:glycosyltransferase [Candidatus Saccharibacteria bacterium]